MSRSRVPRNTLNRDLVLRAALEIADADGLRGLTIRALATRLGATPMAVYGHVANKDEILDRIVDAVFAEMALPHVDGDWREQVFQRCVAARETLRRHPWALGLIDSRAHPGPETLAHHNTMIATLRAGGFSWALMARAMVMLDSYVYGFVLQESALPVAGPEDFAPVAEEILASIPAGVYPDLAAFTRAHVQAPGYDFAAEFEPGLELILDTLAARRVEG